MAIYEELDVGTLNVTKMVVGVGAAAQSAYPALMLKGENKNISANGTTTAQTVQALTIPAGTLVLQVITTVVTSANATCTATIGDGTAAAGWDAAVNLEVAGRYNTSSGDTNAAGKVYSAEDTIDATITFSTTTTTGVYRIDALCVKL